MTTSDRNWRRDVGHLPINDQLLFGVSSGFITALDLDQLVDQGADPNLREGLPLAQIARDGKLELVAKLIDRGANANNSWALAEASRYGHLEVAKYLLNGGANAADDSSAALFAATRAGHSKIVDLLYPLSEVDVVLAGMSFGEEVSGSWAHVLHRRQSELDAVKLQSETQSAAGDWCPSPQQADAFAERITTQAQGNAQEAPKQQQRARQRL